MLSKISYICTIISNVTLLSNIPKNLDKFNIYKIHKKFIAKITIASKFSLDIIDRLLVVPYYNIPCITTIHSVTCARTPAASLRSPSPRPRSARIATTTSGPPSSEKPWMPSSTQQMEPRARSAEILVLTGCSGPAKARMAAKAPCCTNRRHRLFPSRARLVMQVSATSGSPQPTWLTQRPTYKKT